MPDMEWISVNEHLPDDPSWVLVYADGAMNCMAFDEGQWKEWTAAKAHNIFLPAITHWMPLPKPPTILPKHKDWCIGGDRGPCNCGAL